MEPLLGDRMAKVILIVPGHLPIQGELGQAEADGGHGDEDAVKDPQHGQDVPEGHLKEGNVYCICIVTRGGIYDEI